MLDEVQVRVARAAKSAPARVDGCFFEGGPAGRGLEPYLRRKWDRERLAAPLHVMSHMGDKVAKNSSLAMCINLGELHVPDGAEWLDDFKAECSSFDGQGLAHDDLVDGPGIAIRGADILWPGRVPGDAEPEVDIRKSALADINDIISKHKRSHDLPAGLSPIRKARR